MTDASSPESYQINGASSQQLFEESAKYATQLLNATPSTMEFAILLTGYRTEGSDDVRVQSLIGGESETLAAAIAGLLDDMTSRDPEFGNCFMAEMAERMRKIREELIVAGTSDELGSTH